MGIIKNIIDKLINKWKPPEPEPEIQKFDKDLVHVIALFKRLGIEYRIVEHVAYSVVVIWGKDKNPDSSIQLVFTKEGAFYKQE